MNNETRQPVPSGTQDEREPLSAILAKCEQYWNEPNICDAEVHAVLEFIHRKARESVSLLDAERKRVQELQKELGKPEYYWRRRYKEIACVDIFQKQRVQELEVALRKLLRASYGHDEPNAMREAEALLPKEQKRGE